MPHAPKLDLPPVAVYSSKSDMVTAIVREMILTGRVEHGTQLRQRDLAAQLGVSPTPVREALRRLEAEGLLESDPHRGSTVIASDDPGADSQRIRAVLEAHAAADAAERIDERQLAELEAINKQLAALGARDPAARTELDARFHAAVVEAADSPMLASLVGLLWRGIPHGAHVARPAKQTVREHAELIAALRDGDGPRAAELARVHVLGAPARAAPARRGARRAAPQRRRLARA